ncbi:DNA polymerase III, epsilon subunit [Elusimicrobium minutum Pei191]|uniref:DNA polymerase III, epsilon subunit n=1 Tax=Elusimicrobium minutum (strain Pei191) TaxID=445932 RepID=B2KEE3_ELUMP|nr:3'-5' exonuclease [Elusimicrobium minutum]ACC98889.1 DNA polymerase III, epsilon subunit [Elusimicrobium minutum Pei191]
MILREKLIHEVKFAFLDTETTGLSPYDGARLCEIAVITNGALIAKSEYGTIINPRCVISQEVINIHGITNEMAAQAPYFEDIAPLLIGLLTDSVIVCHNADFDIPFLAAEFARCGLRMPQTVILDTLKFARKNGNFKKNNLGFIVSELGLSNEGWHRAMADAKMTEKVFYHFLAAFKQKGAATIGDLEEFQVKRICGSIRS